MTDADIEFNINVIMLLYACKEKPTGWVGGYVIVAGNRF